jgi:predicted transposase YbfD/YdcC
MISFFEYIKDIPDHRVPGMVIYPLSEVLLVTLVGVLCGADDWDIIEMLGREYLSWFRQFLPFNHGIPQAQTLRKIFAVLPPKMLEERFAAWVKGLQGAVRGVVAIDGKTLRGSKKEPDGKGALHLLSAYACDAGLVIGQRAVDGKSNEITAIPELLDALAVKGAIVSIDAMGTQKAIAAKIVAKDADYVLALKGNHSSLHDDVKRFFDEPALAETCATHSTTNSGHGRIEERTIRATEAIDWLIERHPDWQNLRSIAAVTSRSIHKKTGKISTETRFYISSLPADPAVLLASIRAHWAIENNLHWQLDLTFREDEGRTRKDFAPLNLAIIRRVAFNLLKQDPSALSMRRKRIKASVNPAFRELLLTR